MFRTDPRAVLLLLAGYSGAGCWNPAEEGTNPDLEADTGRGVGEPEVGERQPLATEPEAEPETVEQEQTAKPDPDSSSMYDFAPIPLSRMIGIADLVILGSVTDVREDTYGFRVAKVVVGETEDRSLEVRQFHPRVFEVRPRAMPYSAGQTFLLFLTREPDEPADSPWQNLGYAGEGEMPVEDDYVHMPHILLEGLEPRRHEVHGAERETRRYPLEAFLEVIEEYRSCFTWTIERKKHVPERAADESRVESFRGRNALTAELARETLRALPKR